MEILEHIYTRSKFISEAKESAVLVKITGRLIGLNINQIISKIISLRKKDSPFVSAYLNGRKPWADSRFIFFSLSYFPLLLSCKNKISTTYYFEHAVTESALSAMKSDIRLIYPPLPIRIDGIGGGFGVVYNVTDFEYFKQRVKHQLRRILFRIGILPVKKESRK